jgi:hypothetical protein
MFCIVRSQRIWLAYKQNVRATVSEFTFLLAHIFFRHFFLIEPSKAEYVADAPSLLLYSYAHTFFDISRTPMFFCERFVLHILGSMVQ